MASPQEIIESTEWSELEHAYGGAEDLPERLLGLLSEDRELVSGALGVLDAAVLHQGTIYSSTAPAALFVAGILTDRRAGIVCESSLPWDDRVRPVRAALLEWLGSVGESIAYRDGGSEDDEAGRACRAVRPDLYRAIAPLIWDDDPTVASEALIAAGQLLRAPELAEHRSVLALRLMEETARKTPRDRAHLSVVLDSWGIAPRPLLLDGDPAVRAYAAAATTLGGDPDALTEVRTALLELEAQGRPATHRSPALSNAGPGRSYRHDRVVSGVFA